MICTCSGDYNLILILIAENFDSLRAFIEKNIRSIAEVRKISVNFGDVVRPDFVPIPFRIHDPCCIPNCDECEMLKDLQICSGCAMCRFSFRGLMFAWTFITPSLTSLDMQSRTDGCFSPTFSPKLTRLSLPLSWSSAMSFYVDAVQLGYILSDPFLHFVHTVYNL